MLIKEGFSGLEEITKHLPGGVFAEVNTKETKGRSFTLRKKIIEKKGKKR